MNTKRNWKTFYQVWVKYKNSNEWENVFATSSASEVRQYAENRISFGGVQRVEIKDHWGDRILETVYDRSWYEPTRRSLLDVDSFGEKRSID